MTFFLQNGSGQKNSLDWVPNNMDLPDFTVVAQETVTSPLSRESSEESLSSLGSDTPTPVAPPMPYTDPSLAHWVAVDEKSSN